MSRVSGTRKGRRNPLKTLNSAMEMAWAEVFALDRRGRLDLVRARPPERKLGAAPRSSPKVRV